MAVTRYQRKERRLKTRATKRKDRLKLLSRKPPIKNVDIEELKKSFKTSGSTKASETTDKKAE